jgi:Zn-dependent protease
VIRARPSGGLFGVPITVGWSWLAVVAATAGVLFIRLLPDAGSVGEAAAIALVGAAVLFASVVVHELSHAVVARRRGIGVRRVGLFALGGYTEMDREPSGPGDELAVAAAGPIASLLLGALLWVGAVVAGASAGVGGVLSLLAAINVGVAVFNLLPGLPLDGGRVLRALVWERSGDALRATRVAAEAGRVLGVALVAVGAGLGLAGGDLLIAALSAVAGGVLYHTAAAAGRTIGSLGTPVGRVMRPPPRVAALHPEGLVAPAAVDGVPVPVVEGERVVGTVTGPVPPGTPVSAVMMPLRPSDVIEAATPIGAVAGRIRRRGRPAVIVSEGRMVGVVSPEDAAEWLRRARRDGLAVGRSGR